MTGKTDKLVIYACGGTGSNVAAMIKNLDVEVVYVDTSDSNVRRLKNPNFFHIKDEQADIDGAGKLRRTAYEAFKGKEGDVLIKYPPSRTLNLVINSMGGGTGSAVGPMLARELIGSDHPTICIAIPSIESGKEISNTLDTLMTYRSIPTALEKCLALFYAEANSRAESDSTALHFITLCELLVNRKATDRFDRSDIINFINYNRVAEGLEPGLAVLELNDAANGIYEPNTFVVGSIKITSDPQAVLGEPRPEYIAECLVIDDSFKSSALRLDSILGKAAIHADNLKAAKSKQADSRQVSRFRDVAVTGAGDDGMVI